MALLSGLMMYLLMVLSESAGAMPIEFRAVDAESGQPLYGVKVRQLPPMWEVRFLLQRPRDLSPLKGKLTNPSGVVSYDASSRATYFFEADDYVSVDVRKGWFGLKAYEDPFNNGSDLKIVDGVYVVPMRKKDEGSSNDAP